MLFKVDDVLEYNNGYYAIIREIDDNDVFLDLSDGSRFIIKRSKLINGVVKGNIKIKNLIDGVKPIPWFNKKFDF